MSKRQAKRSPISPVLFMTLEGEPMRFFLRPGPTKQRLQPQIKAGGGLMTSAMQKQAGAILLAEPEQFESLPKNVSHWYVSTQYIEDCVEKNEQLDVEDYRVNPESQQGPSSSTKKKASRHSSGGTGRLPYTPEEDAAILSYLAKRKDKSIGGNQLWQEMGKNDVTGHSWQSMKARYAKCLARRQTTPEQKRTNESETEADRQAPSGSSRESDLESSQSDSEGMDVTNAAQPELLLVPDDSSPAESAPPGTPAPPQPEKQQPAAASSPAPAQPRLSPSVRRQLALDGHSVAVVVLTRMSRSSLPPPTLERAASASPPPSKKPKSTHKLPPPINTSTPQKRKDTSSPPKDTSSPPKDTSTPQKDTSTPQKPKDTSTPQKDTSTPQKPKDASTPPKDTSTPQKPKDTSSPQKDTSTPQKQTDTSTDQDAVHNGTSTDQPRGESGSMGSDNGRASASERQAGGKRKRKLGILEMASKEFESSDDDQTPDSTTSIIEEVRDRPNPLPAGGPGPTTTVLQEKKGQPPPPEKAACPGVGAVPPLPSDPPPPPTSSSTLSKAHLFIFDGESQDARSQSVVDSNNTGTKSKEAVASLTQTQLGEDIQRMKALMKQTDKDLQSVTKALLRASGDFAVARALLLTPSSVPGPIWTRPDDNLLRSGDPVVRERLQDKYGVEAVAKRMLFLEELRNLTLVLLQASEDLGVAWSLLLAPSSVLGPFWSRWTGLDDNFLLSGDLVVRERLQDKFGEEAVAKRMLFLEVE